MSRQESDFFDDMPSYEEVPPPPIMLSDEERERQNIARWFRDNPRYERYIGGCLLRVELSDWPDFVDDFLNS